MEHLITLALIIIITIATALMLDRNASHIGYRILFFLVIFSIGLFIWKVNEILKEETEEQIALIKKAVKENRTLICNKSIVRNPIFDEDKNLVISKETNKVFDAINCEIIDNLNR